MAARVTVKPDLRYTKLAPGGRYMINKAQAGPHGCPVYPYNELMMESNKNLVEFFPKFKEVEAAEAPVAPMVDSISMDEEVEIEEVTVDVQKPAPVEAPKETAKESPLEKARRVAAENRAKKLAAGE